jgi:hypothetical protein
MVDDIQWGNFRSVHQIDLWRFFQQSILIANREDLAQANEWLLFTRYFCHIRRVLLHSVKSYGIESLALFPLQRKVICGFYRP